MEFKKIFIESWKLTKHKPQWWSLVFFQILSLSFLLKIKKPYFFLLPEKIFVTLFLVLVLSSIVVFLWTSILKNVLKTEYEIKYKIFQIGQLVCLYFLAVLFANLLHFLIPAWTVFAVLASLLFISVCVCSLFCVVFKMNLSLALLATIDFWKKKSGILSLLSCFTIVLHGFSFALVRVLPRELLENRGFSFFVDSGTIWLLCILSVGVFVIIGTFINIFAVLSFINIVKPVKTQENLMQEQKLAVQGNF